MIRSVWQNESSKGGIASREYFQGARADADRITNGCRLVINKFGLEIWETPQYQTGCVTTS